MLNTWRRNDSIYNSKELCFDKELTFLSYSQKINQEFTISDIINGELWKVYNNDGVYKCIPLFNCDLITSSNDSDIIIEDNKCLILTCDDDTIVKVISDDTGSIHYHSLQLYAFAPYTRLQYLDQVAVSVIVYDEFLNTLNNALINVIVDGDVVNQIQTNNNGIAVHMVSEACEVSFSYDDNYSNGIIITEE